MTLKSLADRGLVEPSGPQHSAKKPAWQLTAAGLAAVEQLQGLRIRIINTVMVELDDHQVHAIQGALQGVGDTLANLRLHEE